MSYWDLLREPSSRAVSLPLWTVWACFGFTYYGLVLFVGRLYTSSNDNDNNSCSFDYSSIFLNAVAELGGVALSALAIDRVGRVQTQTRCYLAAAGAAAAMGAGLDPAAVLVVSFLGRMAVMAASVSHPNLSLDLI